MKRVVLLAVLALAFPIAARADSNIDISRANGTFAVSAGGVTLTHSPLFKVGTVVGSNLGRVGFATGALTGSLSTGATFGTGKFTINQLGFKGSSAELSSGDTSLAVPEPGTLGLLGTGLVGIAGLLRRKFNSPA
jgi:hypothetical protein